MKTYTPDVSLAGEWIVTRKLDGVQVIFGQDGVPRSRGGKVFVNLLHFNYQNKKFEVFCGDWSKTISKLKGPKIEPVEQNELFELEPDIDPRLIIGIGKLDAKVLQFWLDSTIRSGYEGLVISRLDGEMYKLKPKETHDVPILGIVEGKGRNKGRVGSFITPKGKVGSGIPDTLRQSMFSEDVKGTIIEVESMELTSKNKFRHPRFIRVRWDKMK